MTKPIILASASPRRRELLAELGIRFTTCRPEVDERVHPGEPPGTYALRVARKKAQTAASISSDSLVIGADTIVVLDSRILGKPGDGAEARAHLTLLRGRRHDVATAVAVVDSGTGRVESGIEWTAVWLREFDEAELEAYIASGDPFDKAGAYAIQHPAFQPVARLEGSETNVIGLPLGLLERLLRSFSSGPPPLSQQ